jgi:hypothetical protein
MHNSDMPAIERDIQGFLNIIRPTSLSLLGDSDSDQECPICHELFPEFDYDGSQDYPVSQWLRRPGSQCEHIFGRICIERHIRSGEYYSMRCPICREQWFGFWQAEPADEFELDDDRLSRALARRLQERQNQSDGTVEVHELEAGIIDPGTQSFTLSNRTSELQARHGASVVRRVYRSIGLLESMRSFFLLQSVNEDKLAAVLEVEDAVERLWQRLDERNQHQ